MTKIELKRINFQARMSEETNCYRADLWVNGAKIAEVGNDGRGGCDHFHPSPGASFEGVTGYAIATALDLRLASECPPIKLVEGLDSMPASLETVCGDLLADFISQRDLTRLMGRSIVLFDPETKCVSTVRKIKPPFPAEIFAKIEKAFPTCVILNRLPLDQAFAHYRASV